jgi:hypothetical protein
MLPGSTGKKKREKKEEKNKKEQKNGNMQKSMALTSSSTGAFVVRGTSRGWI